MMTPIITQDLELTKHLVTQYLQDQPVQIWFFGSRAWGGWRRSSDIDVGILPSAPLHPGCLLELQEVLDQSAVLPRVELFDLSSAVPALRDRVIQQGIPWRT